jgi:hypothetical protein
VKQYLLLATVVIAMLIVSFAACKKDDKPPAGMMQLFSIKIGNNTLNLQGNTINMPVDQPISLIFSNPVDTNSAKNSIRLMAGQTSIAGFFSFSNDLKTCIFSPEVPLQNSTSYLLSISDQLKGFNGETFPGYEITFATVQGKLTVTSATINNKNFLPPQFPKNISLDSVRIEITFSHPLDPADFQPYFILSGNVPIVSSLSGDHLKVTVRNLSGLEGYRKYFFSVSNMLTAQNGFTFDGFDNSFFSALDSTYKFPPIPDEDLLELIQQQTFRYFYDFAHPVAGLARERNTSGDVVTIGGSGFGVMALIVGMERQFITRQQGLEHLGKIVTFLETCDRYHGAWPHWLNGTTGQTHPFSTQDDGADLVETGFMIQGLMTMRQYLDPLIPVEQALIGRINTLMDEVEWDWFTRGGQNALYWHWSPNHGWAMNMKIQGFNETLIVYVMAASSQTHTIGAEVYHQGYARNGAMVNGNSYYGYTLPLGWAYGGPLFFTHYSHLGLDPRNLQDQYANLWEQNVNMSLINWAYCADNPKNYLGYSEVCWGLTASDNPNGYSAHSPTNDRGVITPTAAVSSLPYTPEQSMNAIRHFYYLLGDRLWGEYGFYDAFSVTDGWWANSYLAIDQGPIVCMIENYRTGLLWDLFMSAPEVQQGLDKLGFVY